MKQKSLQYKIAIWLTMGLLVVDPVVMPFSYAENPIEVDRQAPQDRQAQVTQAGNGVTLVNVTGPTAGGVSRNDYTKFNVPESGTILNNSYGMSNTALAGYVPGNANMARGAARVILNEVTSTNPTAMKGFLEVAGQKASVVVANPNGISVDGGGFINTDRAVLTTGKPGLTADGAIQTYRVEQGAVSVNGNGLNAKGANALQILTEAAHINAGVWANEADIRTGKNVVDANTLDTQRIGTSNQVGLDVAAIGGMYANAITMKGSNTGLGVNVKGVVSAAKATNITSDGRIVVSGGVTSNGHTAISGQAVTVGASGIVQGDASATVESQTTVDNAGLINSGDTTRVQASTVDNHDGGRVYGDGVSIKANQVNNHTNRELETRYHAAGDALQAAKKALDDEWNADITGYKTQEELEVHKQRIQHLTKAYDDAQTQLNTIETEFATHKSATIAGRNAVDVEAKYVTNEGRGLIYSGGSMRVTAKEDLTNTGATIKSAGSMTIDAPVVKNENAAFGAKRVSDGVTKNPDKLKVNDPNHKLEGQVFDKSEFPYADSNSGYGTPRVIPVHSAEDEEYNKEMDKDENRVHKFTVIRSQTEQTHTDITHDDPGVISSGGDMTVSGAIHNTNSRIVAGGTVRTNGAIDNQSDEVSEKTIATGTTQESYTKRVRKSSGIGHKRRRYWRDEVFMTPSITERNVKPVGVVKDHAEDVLSTSTIAKVNDSLDPYGLGKGNGKRSGTIDGLSLPTESLYRIHPDITANALVETDPAFTDRKQFLSSQYMIDALNQDPDRRLKRLGDGFYEQQLVNQQILAATGRQYLTGYSDNEAEYKALLEAGIAYGKQFHLTPGITLSDAQMQAITTDMVWLETKTILVNGKEQQVFYPKVYLAKQPAKSLDAMGGLISGRAIVSDTDADIHNQGVMTADTIVLNGQNIHNTGTIDGRTVAVAAKQDVNTTGAIHGDTNVAVRAGRDVNVGARVKALSNQDVVRRQGTVGVSEPGGQLSIAANRDVHLKGALVHGGSHTTMDITAGYDVNLGTEQLAAKKDMTVNSDNYNRTERRTELGTTILGDGDVAIRAGHDVSVRNGVVNSEQGTTTMAAGHDVNVTAGESYSRDEYGIKYKEKSLLSKTVRTLRTDHEHTGVLSSTIGGNAIDMKANHDVSLTGANVLGTKDVNITAGHDVRTDSGEERQRDDIYEHSKKTGLMSAGIGFTIGSKKVTDTLDGKYTNQVATNIASSKGDVAVNAGNSIHSTATNYFSNQPAELTASDVTIDGKHNVTHEVQSHEEKRSGLTVSVGGSVVSSLNTAQQLGKKAHNRQSSALSAFEYGELANAAKHAYNDAKAYKSLQPMRLLDNEKAVLDSAAERNISYRLATHDFEGIDPAVEKVQNKQNAYKVQQAKDDRLFNIKVGIGSSQYKQTSELDQAQYVGSSIGSNVKVTVTGTGETPNTGNVHITGSTIDAPEVHINAKNNIRLDAGTNTSIQINDYTQSGWSVGATISPHGNGVIGLDANVFNGKEKGVETITTHAGTVIRGRQLATTTSGNNTDILGSKITGNTVVTNAGNDLRIESLQDTHDYHKNSRNKSLSVSYGMSGPALVGFENGKGTTDSHYASVTDQAGIYTGEGGYHVQVGNATTLTGGIIKGSPDTSKNKLSSKSLEMKDIQNEASYSAKTSGYSLSTTKRTKNNPIGITGSPNMGIPVKGSAKSTTHSAISEGIIELAEKESLDKINHDTERALNKLAPIFDKKKVEEKQILLTKISNQGYKLIGDIALHQQKVLYDKAKKTRDNNQKNYYRKEAEKWGEHGIYKIGLHAGFGAFISNYSGNTAIKGVKTAGVNEILQGSLGGGSDPNVRKLVSAIIGRVVGGEVGESIALSETENNWLNHYDQVAILKLVNDGALGEANLAYFIALDEQTIQYADQLGIDESIDSSMEIGSGRYSSLFNYFVERGIDTSRGLSYALRELARINGYSGALFDYKIQSYKEMMDYNYLHNHYLNLNKGVEYGNAYAYNFIESGMHTKVSGIRAEYYRDTDGQLVKELMNGDIEETGIFKGVENMNSQVPLEYTGSFYQSGNNYVPTDKVPDNIRTIISQGFYSDSDGKLGLQLVTIGGVRYIQDQASAIILKVSPDFIIDQQSLNKSVGSETLNKIISRGYIEEADLDKVITTRENGKTYVMDSETGERILADSGLLLLSQGKSRYEIANDRFKRIGTNKRVGLTGVIPVYKVLSISGSVTEQKNSNGDIIRIYEGGGGVSIPIKVTGVNITQPISGSGVDLGVTNSYNADIQPDGINGIVSANGTLLGNQYSIDTDNFKPSNNKVVGTSLISGSVDAKIQYREKLKPVVDTSSDNAFKNNFGDLSSISKKSLGIYSMNPSIGKRYIDKETKNIFIIRKVNSVTYQYEILDELDQWRPLRKSDFDMYFYEYKG